MDNEEKSSAIAKIFAVILLIVLIYYGSRLCLRIFTYNIGLIAGTFIGLILGCILGMVAVADRKNLN